MSSRPKRTVATPRRARPLSAEEKIIMRREKEELHQRTWGERQRYYDWWEKTNQQYDAWTSPRYYDANAEIVARAREQKTRAEMLETRREKLRKMLLEEAKDAEMALMQMRKKEGEPRRRYDEIPTEILKEIREGIKAKEEEKRRKEAELKLYHRWRENNPFLREYEQLGRTHDLKRSWMHQQMEKRKRAEEEREERERAHRQMEERLKQQEEEEELTKQRNERRNRELTEIIDQQVAEMKSRQAMSEELRRKEEEERAKKLEVAELEAKQRELTRIAKQRETALYNVKQYKLKLQKKIEIVRENLREQEEIMKKLKDSELADQIEDDKLKSEIKTGIDEFLRITGEQKRLEKLREKHLQFIFDSEAQAMYEKQSAVWEQEEQARNKLADDVLRTISEQIEQNHLASVAKKNELLAEREVLVRATENYKKELDAMKVAEMEERKKRKEELDRAVKTREEKRKAESEDERLRKITEELERARIEEERLKREIMNLHRGHGSCTRASKSNIAFY